MEFKPTDFKNCPVHVYVAQFPFPAEEEKIAPAARAKDIEGCANQQVRTAKYFVWKLLENALMRSFGLRIGELEIAQSKSGKWECPECFFSLSHSGNLAAVAVSAKPVGIDIERRDEARFTPSLARKILTCSELKEIEQQEGIIRSDAINALWTKKEALFKLAGEGAFLPNKIETSGTKCATKIIVSGEEQYFFTVAAEDAEQAIFRLAYDLKLINFE